MPASSIRVTTRTRPATISTRCGGTARRSTCRRRSRGAAASCRRRPARRHRRSAGPPNQLFPGFLNINRTQDVAISLTKVWGSHTSKAGFYNNHSFKAQNTGAGGVANLGFQGYVNFGNDTNNALDTGFGFANAAAGVFTQYLQQSKLIEGSMIYNNTEFYVQDNWKVNGTADARLRRALHAPAAAVRPVPADVELLRRPVVARQAPLLYVSGCSNGATVCSGNARNAVDPRTGQIVTAPGAANTAALIGTVDPGHRQPDQRHPEGRRRHRRHVLRLAEAGRRTALRHGLRHDGQPDDGVARRAAGSSTIAPTATRSSRFRATRRSRRRRTCGTANCRRSAPVSAASRRSGADHVPVQRAASVILAVAGRRADRAAVVDDRSTYPTSATTASTGCARSRAAPAAPST